MHSANNIWKIPEGGGKPVQVTHHKDGSLFFPSISSDGKVIVYEENFGLWKLDTATGKTSEVKIDITSDDKENEFALLTIRNEADSYDLSPSTRRAVISAHGEVFTIATSAMYEARKAGGNQARHVLNPTLTVLDEPTTGAQPNTG